MCAFGHRGRLVVEPLFALLSVYIHYQVDDDEGAAVLSLEAYGGDDESSWLLLEPVAE